MGFGVQRKRTVLNNDLPDNPLYRNFVRAGANMTEEEWVGGPAFEGKKTTFEEESGEKVGEEVAKEEEGEGTKKKDKKGGKSSKRKREEEEEEEEEPVETARNSAPGEFTLKSMKGWVLEFLGGNGGEASEKGVKRKWVRSAAVEEVAGDDEDGEKGAGELFDRALGKLVKKGKVEELELKGVAHLRLCS